MVRVGAAVRVVIAAFAVALLTASIASAQSGLPPGGTFGDDDGSIHEGAIEAIYAAGITVGCTDDGDLYCPDRAVTRAEMATFLTRALDLPNTPVDAFTDDAASVHHGSINAVALAGIAKGCDPPANSSFCPDDSVTRGQMAAFLVRGFDLSDPGAGDHFSDDDSIVFEADIDMLATAGITKGCNPPDNDLYCPSEAVSRAEMATFLMRALDLDPIIPPPPTTTTTTTTTTEPPDDGQGYGCHPAYVECVPNHPVDVDCAGGSGNGPVYVEGPIHVKDVDNDPYGLDHDNDGIGCED